MFRLFIFLIAILPALPGSATEHPDSLTAAGQDTVPPRHGLISKIIGYFSDANKPQPDPRAFDISFIGGPYYSSETSLGLGIVASGTYRTGIGHLSDSAALQVPPSVIALTAKASITGYFEVGAYGTNIFASQRLRLVYDLHFRYLPTYFWGIGYDMAIDDANKTKYVDESLLASADLLVDLGRGFFVGPTLNFDLTDARRLREPMAPWDGLTNRITTLGMGLTASFDTRDNLTAPRRGIYLAATQLFCPRFLGNNSHSFSATDLTFNIYVPLWRGATGAGHLYSRYAYGKVPWSELSTFGGSHDMRGYYEGQYRDKFAASLTLELRQHVWRRNGIALWADLGAVAPRPADLRLRRLLPGCGIGYRWEFKRNSNVRVDFGLGRHSHAFLFSINEAF